MHEAGSHAGAEDTDVLALASAVSTAATELSQRLPQSLAFQKLPELLRFLEELADTSAELASVFAALPADLVRWHRRAEDAGSLPHAGHRSWSPPPRLVDVLGGMVMGVARSEMALLAAASECNPRRHLPQVARPQVNVACRGRSVRIHLEAGLTDGDELYGVETNPDPEDLHGFDRAAPPLWVTAKQLKDALADAAGLDHHNLSVEDASAFRDLAERTRVELRTRAAERQDGPDPDVPRWRGISPEILGIVLAGELHRTDDIARAIGHALRVAAPTAAELDELLSSVKNDSAADALRAMVRSSLRAEPDAAPQAPTSRLRSRRR